MNFPKPKKSLGQNFLKDKGIIKEMVSLLDIKKGEIVIEIGPGTGVITNYLLESGAQVIAVEYDESLADKLENDYRGNDQIKIISGSILDFSLTQLVNNREYKLIGAIPYQITSPILHQIVEEKQRPKRVVMIVQRELGKKVEGEEDRYSYLSNFVSIYYEARCKKNIKPIAFYPKPKVDSTILILDKKDEFLEVDIRRFSRFLHKGFANPRKMIKKVFGENVLSKANIKTTLRPQNIKLEEWIRLYELEQ